MFTDLPSLVFIAIIVSGLLRFFWLAIKYTPDAPIAELASSQERDRQLHSIRQEMRVHITALLIIGALMAWLWRAAHIGSMDLLIQMAFALPAGIWLMSFYWPIRMRRQIRWLKRHPSLY